MGRRVPETQGGRSPTGVSGSGPRDDQPAGAVLRVLEVKRAYRLTVDVREAAALEAVLAQCVSTAMEPVACTATPATQPARGSSDALSRNDDNRNGRITCAEARRHRIAPVHRSHPAYRYMRDGDKDSVVCE